MVVSVFSIVAPHLRAQDVTVTPFDWVSRDAPEQMPALRRALQPAFPRDLRNTPDFGWAALELFVDEKGKFIGGRREATLPAYHDAVEQELSGIKFEPGRRAGQPVITQVRCAVIFNPASAALNTPEATPRLLEARPFTDPTRRGQPNGPALEARTIWAIVSLDEQGKPWR